MRSVVFHPIIFTAATAYLTYRALAANPEGIGLFTGLGLGVLWLGVVVAWWTRRGLKQIEAERRAARAESAADNRRRD